MNTGRIVIDIDETLCEGPYEDCRPKEGAKDTLEALKAEGWTVVLYTARGMGRSAGNAGVAVATMGPITIDQLKEWGFVYDELHFGKPSGDVYVDDKAIPDLETLRYLLGIDIMPNKDGSMVGGQSILEYRVGQMEAQMALLRAENREMFSSIDKKLGDYLSKTNTLEVELRHTQKVQTEHAADMEHLESALEKKSEDISDLKVGIVSQALPGLASGGVIVSLVEVIKYLTGHA